jgi:hypothetical protein
MENQSAKDILKKYASDLCTPEEKAIVETWFIKTLASEVDDMDAPDYYNKEQEILRSLPAAPRTVNFRLSYKVAAALLIFAFFSVVAYIIVNQRQARKTIVAKTNDFAPGGNKAILTLANGHKIILSATKNGVVARQGNTQINKTSEGEVIYEAGALPINQSSYNTMTTPRGGQYHLVLADHTNVWLNAASSIKFPVAFNGKYREVEITGEAYFEVAHDAAKPFRVLTNGQAVEVLGTHFNINAYPDEANTQTTLLEGSVKITKGNNFAIVRPGQQAITSTGTNKIECLKVNTAVVVAWKEGYFRFDNSDLPIIMRQFSRWYNIEVEYEGSSLGDQYFKGKISRASSLSRVLKILEAGGIHFKIKDNKLIVLPNQN